MPHFQANPDIEAKAAFLMDHFLCPDILTGTDLLTGKHLYTLNPEDPLCFFRAHILGPGKTKEVAKVAVSHADGSKEWVTSFYRPKVRPFDREGRSSTISISISGQPGLDPTPSIEGIVDTLRLAGYEPIVERSFQLCHWVIWLLLDEPSPQRSIEHEAYRLYALIRDRQLVPPENLVVPAIDKEAIAVYLPHQFFAGDFFGQLYQLRGGALHPLDLAAVPHNRLGAGVSSLRDYKAVTIRRHLDDLMTEWWSIFGPRPVRANHLLCTMRSSIQLAFSLRQGVKHAESVELGGYLMQLNGRVLSGKTIRSRQSGHSSVYWLEDAPAS